MLSFELSAVDIVLVIAVVTMILLFLAQKQEHSATKSKLPLSGVEKLVEKPEVRVKTILEKVSVKRRSTDFEKCVHSFAYLRNHPKNAPIPEECFGCPRTLDCLFSK